MDPVLFAQTLVASAGTSAMVVWLARSIITERLKAGIKHEYDLKFETVRVGLQAEMQKAVAVHQSSIQQEQLVATEAFKLKHAACLQALDVMDRVMTNHTFQGGKQPERRQVTVDELREVYNRLAISCEHEEVIAILCKILGMRKVDEPGWVLDESIVQDFRNAIRRELGFGTDLALDRARAWIGFFDPNPQRK